MGFWSNLFGTPDYSAITPNSTVSPDSDPGTVSAETWTAGDPDGFELQGEETFSRSLPMPHASPWSGWPADWATPNWQGGLQKLIDTAWACLDLNSSILSTMPVYRMRSGRVVEATLWMSNPDPAIYTSWHEFAKQLFWDYQMGEAFVLPSEWFANGNPSTFRVIPPWMVNVEMARGVGRVYRIGATDVTSDILHIRYRSSTQEPRGSGPLDAAGARMVAAGVLAKYVAEIAKTGGLTNEWITTEQPLTKAQADELQEQWLDSKARSMGLAGVFGRGATLEQSKSMSAKDMALLELAQFTESRVAIMLGVPPFLVGLPSGGDSMTYSNVSSLFDYHDRASLRPKAAAVMSALSWWALPRGQHVELNRDEYTRPAFNERAEGYKLLAETGEKLGKPVIDAGEIRTMERLHGDVSAEALTGGDE